MLNQYALRPRTMGQLLDAAVRIYRSNFWTLLGIVAIIQLPVLALSLFFTASTFQNLFATMQSFDNPAAIEPIPLWQSALSNLNTVAASILGQFSAAALVVAVGRAVFGQKTTFREAYSHAFSRWQSILGTLFLTTATLIALVIAAFLLFLTLIGWLGGFGALLFFSLGISTLIMPVLILEEASAWNVIGRAWQLVRHNFWRAVGYGLLLVLVVYVIQIGPAGLLGALLGFVAADSTTALNLSTNAQIGIAVAAIGTTLATVVVTPFTLTASLLFYLDLRVRNEGLDLVIDLADETADPIELLANAPKAVPEGRTITWGDFGRCFALGVGLFAVTVGLGIALGGLIASLAAALAF